MHKQGDILLIPVPFTDLTSSKKRPVLVISNDQYNNKTEDIIVAAITSRKALGCAQEPMGSYPTQP